MDRARWRLVSGAVLAAVIVAAGYLGLASSDELVSVGGWSVIVFAVLYGFGGLVRRGLGIELGPGEQLLVGTAVWITLGGVLLVLGAASRVPLLVASAIGVLLCLLEILARARRDVPPRARTDETWAVAACAIVLGGFLVLNLLSMAGSRANPYDDQVAYVALVKRLLDVGNLDEPFSFRRLSAYGGQTMLQALAALRGDVGAIDLLDRGIFQVIGILVVLDIVRRRQLHLALAIGVIAFLLSLWELYLNSAAIWTGFSCFVGAYAFASRDDLHPRVALGLTFATCGIACTLRQNYLVPAGLFAALVLVFHVRTVAHASSWRAALAAERRTIVGSIGAAASVVVPYVIATYLACETFLYPVVLGTGNPSAPLRPTAATFLDELVFFANVSVSSEPIRIWWLLGPLMLLARDSRARRPWPAFLVASLLGFAALIHNFMLSDAYNLWRYGFAYMTALAVVFAIEVATRLPLVVRPVEPPFRLHGVAALLTWIALLVHFVQGRNWPAARLEDAVQNIEAARALGTAKYDPRAAEVARMQQTIPVDEAVAVMIDDPYLLDFSTHDLKLLDLVGFAARWPGLPSFTTPAHWRAYLRAQRIRYLVFSEINEATWLYRRGGWVFRMFSDDELFRYIGAHMVDAIDTFHQLARESTVLYHANGYYVVDLGPAVPLEPDRGAAELVRMYDFIRRFSEQELGTHAWQLASRLDVVFKQDLAGPSAVLPMPGLEPTQPDHGGIVAQLLRGSPPPPHRWLSDRSLVRVHGDGGSYQLRVRAWINGARLQTRPYLSIHFGGGIVAKGQPDRDGFIDLSATVTCADWCNVYLVLSAISEWWLPADAVRGAQLRGFEWTPVR